ncbi:class E sortase [Georgenia sp. Z1344]|uniref:class E sortase n=1 Tax=Georgenia sp. Z1344 TaxID=3416706 RepID=UPI003CF77429
MWGAVGVLGELLLTAGVVLGLYVVWQLWWTDLEGHARQEESVAAIAGAIGAAADGVGEARTDDAPPFASADLELPDGMTALGVVHVPAWGEDHALPLLEGVGMDVIDFGALGHYPGTALPGEIGNHAVAGHRQTHGSPLGQVADLEVGDPIVVETADTFYVYRVTGSEIVRPWDVEVVAPVPGDPSAEPSERLMTLTTCHPFNYSTHRWITYTELDHWVDRSDGMPAELVAASEEA